MIDETTVNKLVKKIRNFFWWSAGVVPQVLEKCDTNQGIYTAIGVMVCFIAILSCISFSYFLSSTFELPAFVGFLGGIVWAGLIYSLERLVLTSLRKGETSLVTIVLRFALVIVTAFVISEPITLFIFRKEIKLELNNRNRLMETKARNEVSARFEEETNILQTANAEIQTRLDAAKSDRDAKENAVIGEVEGKSATGKTGFGIAAKQKETAFIDADAKYKDLKIESKETLNANNERLAEIRKEIIEQTKLTAEISEGADGILARQSALFTIIVSDFGAASTYSGVFLILFFIETLPLTFKVFGKKSVYDNALELEESKQIAELSAVNIFEKENLDRSRTLRKNMADKFLNIITTGNINNLQDENDVRVVNIIRAEALRRIENEVFEREAALLKKADFTDVIKVEVLGHDELQISLQVPENAQRSLSLATINGDIQRIADGIGEKLKLAKAFSTANREISASLPLLTQLEKDRTMILQFEPLPTI
jgi:Domain of unknown function (DUF4407)